MKVKCTLISCEIEVEVQEHPGHSMKEVVEKAISECDIKCPEGVKLVLSEPVIISMK